MVTPQHLKWDDVRRLAITAYRQGRLQFQQADKFDKSGCYYDLRRVYPDKFDKHRNVGCAIGVSLERETIDAIYERYPSGLAGVNQLYDLRIITCSEEDLGKMTELQNAHDNIWREPGTDQRPSPEDVVFHTNYFLKLLGIDQ